MSDTASLSNSRLSMSSDAITASLSNTDVRCFLANTLLSSCHSCSVSRTDIVWFLFILAGVGEILTRGRKIALYVGGRRLEDQRVLSVHWTNVYLPGGESLYDSA